MSEPREYQQAEPGASDQLLRTFLQEGAEQVERMEGLLLQIETSPSPELVAELMRVAHNFKGGAGTAGRFTLADLAHALESVFELLGREGGPSPELFDRILAGLDLLKGSLAVVAQGAEEPAELAAMKEELAHWASQAADACAARTGGPAGISLGEYDLVRMRALRKLGKRIFRIELGIDAAVQDPAAWATDLIARLRRSGDVIATSPPEVDVDLIVEARALTVLLGASLGAQEVVDLLACPGALTPSVEELHAEDAVHARAAPVGPPKPRISVKVDVDRVDSLVDMIGELVIVESMVVNTPEIAAISSRRMRDYLGQLTKITRDLQDVGLSMRMVPLSGLFGSMVRVVRDLARKRGKEVRLLESGSNAEMDRSMVEQITDPLIHLVRNAVDHGIESAEVRVGRGKPAVGTVALSAFHQGGNIVIEVSDDGGGLDVEAILARARAAGLTTADALPSADVLSFILEPGFSTARELNEVSGRGVGLDVVRRNVEALRGRVSVTSRPGEGTTFRITLPITLAIIDGMLVACGRERYIVPTLSIVESIQPKASMLLTQGGRREMLEVRGSVLPLLRLDRLFSVPGAEQDPTRALVVVVEGIGRRVGLMVDEVVAQQQVVIKSLGRGLEGADCLSGAAILPNGRVGLILNIDEIANQARAGFQGDDRTTGAAGRSARITEESSGGTA